ncbi:hypothetical protein [Mucilaginibacter corticis]|nr:hypothetical protein [Mucilaginibacter corticis]
MLEYVKAIEDVDIDLFRPLIRFMNDTVANPHSKHVELLAWLIDYKPRPNRVKDMYDVSGDDQNKTPSINLVENDQTQSEDVEISLVAGNAPEPPKINKRVIALSALSLLVLFVGLFFAFRGRNNIVQKCMYWNGEEFKPIACDEKPDDTNAVVIAKDSDKMVHFRRDTRADTLTASSIGKIWYIKINGRVEYYTAPGAPPLYPDRRLLPLTVYILNKYPRSPG